MNKTAFSEKCNILGDLWLYYREDAERNEAWEEFFTVNDIALPLSYMIANDIALASGDGRAEEFVDETWNMLCDYINVDPNAWYRDLGELFSASSNPPIESPNE